MDVLFSVKCKSFGEFINIGGFLEPETLCNFNLTFDGATISEGCHEQLRESCKNESVLASSKWKMYF